MPCVYDKRMDITRNLRGIVKHLMCSTPAGLPAGGMFVTDGTTGDW